MTGPATLTQRIIHDHLVAGTEEELALRVDQILLAGGLVAHAVRS
jgi:hypothetical protein